VKNLVLSTGFNHHASEVTKSLAESWIILGGLQKLRSTSDRKGAGPCGLSLTPG
jgi:hypothetical protein